VCNNLFSASRFARQKAFEWGKETKEFVKRAGFVLIANLALHDKTMQTEEFVRFLRIIESQADDSRNYVMKAVNWALRQIGKRNLELNKAAVQTARAIMKTESKSAKWISSNALREITSQKVKHRLERKA
jgi:3-methyladenine DNA glycosylase AlkD